MAESEFSVYLRMQDGSCFDADLRDGIEKFLSEDGYRISFKLDGVKFTLRKDVRVDSEMREADALMGQSTVECAVTIWDTNT